MRLVMLLSSLGALLSPVLGAPSSGLSEFHSSGLSERQTNQSCTFDSARSPQCWNGRYSLSTNWYEEAPDTGVVREYWLEITNTTAAPDGVERILLSVNGSLPGPTIFADWGDTLVIHVKNSMQNNGTSIHWHGLRQNRTAEHDGVASITQCPSAPGETQTYRFKATQYGSTWYHSHFSVQAWNGVFGGMVINGPASAPYDEDKGVLVLNDWYHRTSDSQLAAAGTGGPPQAQNGLINGTNVYGNGGRRFQTTVTAGRSYRLRLVNTGMDTHYRFSIDGHRLTVIATDLIPVEPYTTDSVSIGIGQRYDVIVQANQSPGNYWLRSVPQMSCSASQEMTLNIRGIFNYEGVPMANPNTNTTVMADNCNDESNLKPFVKLNVDAADIQRVFDVGANTTGGVFRWTINGDFFLSNWSAPTLEKVMNNVTAFDVQEQIVHLPEGNKWVYFVIESRLGVAHPIHLHGHDFFVLAQEANAVWRAGNRLNLSNPPRRDVAMLPAAGYLVMAYQSDNPGVWLMHCHIGWHTSQGLSLQLVERQSEIAATVNRQTTTDTCNKWRSYAARNGIIQEDSGV